VYSMECSPWRLTQIISMTVYCCKLWDSLFNFICASGVSGSDEDDEEVLAYYNSQSVAATTTQRPKTSTAKSSIPASSVAKPAATSSAEATTAKPTGRPSPTSAKPASSQAKPAAAETEKGYAAPTAEEEEDEEPVAPRPGDHGYLAPYESASSSSSTEQVQYHTLALR
jgi:hypothetical protein